MEINNIKLNTIGKASMFIAMASEEELPIYLDLAYQNDFKVCVGQAGSMEFKKIVATIETAAENQHLIGSSYWEKHALYHAILESFHGVCRGELELGNVLRTVGVRFAVVKGKRNFEHEDQNEWISVALYGTIGAPIKGSEHEVVGLGINHI